MILTALCTFKVALVTGRNEVVAKVMFSQASVILLTGGVYLVLGGVLSPRGVWSTGCGLRGNNAP